ncbi:MAG: 50S ribosomal protein L13 [Syntrophorhabdus sp.]|jgi:large subunit ribosomal protein L13|nr:50S ribosomal protein L13 [Syntrophorhabdus sp.]MDI9558431.1 50S ribosomal protein L13 [Pseudomonadota bacterium]OPX97618.1 MAG: 50S ribosomal protein L13 [Syntrophorhabdus sp. PtaB.Bin027]OQB78493.1 MAG: 50S ribosomal protein L13 [Deltaproteobacteria bacterium ADurb.Bin135]MBP8744681.1 50S ribosomal protein L13 [Syntrophorhabdus sp.]
MKTYFPKTDEIVKDWYLISAEGATLGRLAAQIAMMLRGKTKPTFTPHTDVGDFVVVINAEKIRLTGRKIDLKTYARHSGYHGGFKAVNMKTMLEKKPEEVIRLAVRGMLPKNALGRKIIKKLKIYKGAEHPHKAQMPKEFVYKEVRGA